MTIDAPLEAPWATPEHRRRVVRLCATLTGDALAAEDLAQETLTLAWRLRDRLVDPTARARGWTRSPAT